MKDVRFYEEFLDKRKKQSAGTVVAAFVGNGLYKSGGAWCYDAVGAVHRFPNSPVASTGVARDYLRENCKRVSEKQAREIHPVLFQFLDA